MPALDDTLRQKIATIEKKLQKRELRPTEAGEGVMVQRGGRTLISFSGNDYLGLSRHPRVLKAAHDALDAAGVGAGASRLVTGNHAYYAGLERALADYKHTEAACVFGSGYLASMGSIPALVSKGDLILADKYIHACMLDAARLSGATLMRFAHNNVAHCRMLLEANRAEFHHCLILTETVFSMDGDRAPMRALKLLAGEFDAWLMSDDAHGLGVLPYDGQRDADIQMGTLSKGAGGYGGYVCGSAALIEFLNTASRSLIYSTGLPPATIAAATEALNIIRNDKELLAKPLANARYFTQLMGMQDAQSAIVPVILEENDRAMQASHMLMEHGFLVAAIRPPTVPENTARLRLAFSALHTQQQIEQVAELLKTHGFAA